MDNDQEYYREAAERSRRGLPDPHRLVAAYAVSLTGLLAVVVLLVVVWHR
ncbi:hypothetical protein [Kitasatospora sp. MAP5-34]|nr:hypothetical protein [Kitasatospora sp. MAP5-34]MDH6574569.1 hypothetical protein [Kitasatospora sp. MAP5-34]